MTPSARRTAVFAVALSVAAQRSGVEVVCVAVLSNHYHAVVVDPHGRVPDFLRDLNALVARACNAMDEVQQRFWDGEQAHLERLEDPAAVVAAASYVMTNPVRHHLVERPEQWQGLLTHVEALGGAGGAFARPEGFFDRDGNVPEQVELTMVVPAMCVRAWGVEGFRERVRVAMAARVANARAVAAAAGRSFVGMRRILRQSPFDRPAPPAERRVGRGARAPKHEAMTEQMKAVLEREKVWRARHRAAWERFAEGFTDVVFPHGTWFACRFYGARSETTEPAYAAGP